MAVAPVVSNPSKGKLNINKMKAPNPPEDSFMEEQFDVEDDED